MKQMIFLLTLAAVTAGACVPVRNDGSSLTHQTALLAANSEYDLAIVQADAAALDQIYADDFSFVGDNAELRNKGRANQADDGRIHTAALCAER
ncbi:nuclear transport factor 2 family protein [Tsuneonella aeria]|uniref:nuclear transport factor 2 family protein n=1 Tax=Tsuneonella aeria TaxID=1837929 RepID=UPI001F2E6DF9|nr:nuclear transport factor 2 family protein [Tsuneonella aeria]